MEGLNRAELFNDAQFLQTPEGLLGGTLVLLLFWLLLRLLERWGTSSWSPVIRAVRRPLVLGFGLALFVGWIFGLLAHNLSALTERDVARLTTSIVLIVTGRALIVGGLKFLHSATFNRWLMREIENERERAMMVSLLDRIYSIVIVLITFAAIMVAFGVSPTAVGAVLGGAGIGIGFGTQQISQNFLSALMLFFNRPFAEVTGSRCRASKARWSGLAGITHAFARLISVLCSFPTHCLLQRRLRIQGGCITVGSMRKSVCAMKISAVSLRSSVM